MLVTPLANAIKTTYYSIKLLKININSVFNLYKSEK